MKVSRMLGDDRTDETITGINVTPLVDITFVLLVIFVAVARVVGSQAIPLAPPAHASPSDTQIVLMVRLVADGSMTVDGQRVDDDDALLERARAKVSPKTRAVIRADHDVAHGRVVHALDLLRRAGIEKIAFMRVAEP